MRTLDMSSLLSDTATAWPDVQAEAAAQEEDPLAQALPWLLRHLGVADAVTSALGPPAAGRAPSSDQVLPALRRIGYDARMAHRPIAEFADDELPAVLLLREGDACLLVARRRNSRGEPVCSVVMPGPQALELNVPDAEIAAEYSGLALLVSKTRLPAPVPPVLRRVRAGPPAAAAPPPLHKSTALAVADDSAAVVLDLSFLDRPSAGRLLRRRLARWRERLLAGLRPRARPDRATSRRSLPQRIGAAGRRFGRQGRDLASRFAAVLRPLFVRLRRSAVGAARRRPVAAARPPHAVPVRRRVARAWPALPRVMTLLRDGRQAVGRTLAAVPTAQRLAALPLLAAMSLMCLLIGAPLAWARLVSASSLQAARSPLPAMLREALAVDPDRAVAAAGAPMTPSGRLQAEAASSRRHSGVVSEAAAVAQPPTDPGLAAERGRRSSSTRGRPLARRGARLH